MLGPILPTSRRQISRRGGRPEPHLPRILGPRQDVAIVRARRIDAAPKLPEIRSREFQRSKRHTLALNAGKQLGQDFTGALPIRIGFK